MVPAAVTVALLAAAIEADVAAALGRGRMPREGEVFDATRCPGSGGRRLVRLAFGATAAVAVIVIVTMSSSGRPLAPAARAADAGGLELLSLRSVREPEELRVTGLVRRSGTARTSTVSAVVRAFSSNGDLVASVRAPLRADVLEPGNAARFAASLPRPDQIARYRVSFHAGAGAVRHVDRRSELLRAAANRR